MVDSVLAPHLACSSSPSYTWPGLDPGTNAVARPSGAPGSTHKVTFQKISWKLHKALFKLRLSLNEPKRNKPELNEHK